MSDNNDCYSSFQSDIVKSRDMFNSSLQRVCHTILITTYLYILRITTINIHNDVVILYKFHAKIEKIKLYVRHVFAKSIALCALHAELNWKIAIFWSWESSSTKFSFDDQTSTRHCIFSTSSFQLVTPRPQPYIASSVKVWYISC